jgi:dienelactone hydrolase
MFMRIVLSAVLLASFGTWSSAQTQTPETIATEVVNQLAARRFAEVEIRFDDTMRSALPEDKLSAVWDSVLQQAGEFRRVVKTRVVEQQGFHVVFVTCEFQNAALDVKLALNSQSQIAGMFLVPTEESQASEAQEAWSGPAYAKPDSFHETEVTIQTANWKLPGTLTLPNGKGPFPALVLVHGSGPGDQDETIGPNKPFKDLAWGLATQGIAVLRYVKRTKQYGAESMQSGVPFTVKDETIDDGDAAVALLASRPDVDRKQIYVLGHSLGGMLAPRIATGDKQVAGIILLAGTARPLEDVIIDQLRYIASLPGPAGEAVKKQVQAAEQAKAQIESPALKPDSTVELLGTRIPGSYFLDLRNYHPAELAAQLKIPILVLQGGRDYQVTSADYDLWKAALAKDPRATLKFYPGLTHLFMSAKGSGPGTPQDYAVAGHVSPEVVQDIAQWVKSNGLGK